MEDKHILIFVSKDAKIFLSKQGLEKGDSIRAYNKERHA